MEPNLKITFQSAYDRVPFPSVLVKHDECTKKVIDAFEEFGKEVVQDYVKLRSFDLGGGGLKTGLLYYDRSAETMNWIEPQVQLGRCPDDKEVDEWIRSCIDLDDEIQSGCLFGFSLAGLDKLRSRSLDSHDMSTLFKIPANSIRCIDDGAAHLVASLKVLSTELPKGSIWNFSIGTGVGFGFTDCDRNVRNLYDFHSLFGCWPWCTTEPMTGSQVWLSCGSKYGFDELVTTNNGSTDTCVFNEFASRWQAYLETSVIGYCNEYYLEKGWGTPAAVVFTGGHIEHYGTRLVSILQDQNLKIPAFTGPQNAGLLGSAWNIVAAPLEQLPLIEAIVNEDVKAVELCLAHGAGINKRNDLGYTPLQAAVKTRNVKIVELLLDSGARIDEPDFALETPLVTAARIGEIEIVRLLISRGAEVGIKNVWGQSVEFFGSISGNGDLANLFLAKA